MENTTATPKCTKCTILTIVTLFLALLFIGLAGYVLYDSSTAVPTECPECEDCEEVADVDQTDDEEEEESDDTDEDAEEETAQVENIDFSIPKGLTIWLIGMSFNADVPVGTEVQTFHQDTVSPGVRLAGDDYALQLTFLYEAYPIELGTVDLAFSRTDLGAVYRTQSYAGDGLLRVYVTNPTLNGTCFVFDSDIPAPCGTPVVENADGYSFSAICEGNDEAVAICDDIMESLTAEAIL